jgi:zinc transport system ATP-binding protein
MGGVQILQGVNADINQGEITALIGPNGAGKTTLLLAILEIVPYRGEIIFSGSGERPHIGYVPQQLDFDRGMPVTVLDFLCMGHQRKPLWISSDRRQKARAIETLEWVEAGRLVGKRLGNLSGGELQRTLLAKALLEEPGIILLDEPASAVDRSGEELLLTLIRRISAEQHKTLLLVSHDISMVTRIAAQVICLNRTVLHEGNTADVINQQTLSACFGSDKGILLHDHGWDGDLSCAYDPDEESGGGSEGGKDK